MNVLFVSIMDGFPWGGSEELWYKTAAIALTKGNRVMVCVKGWENEPYQINELRKNGAIILKRKIYKSSFSDRLLRKFAGPYIAQTNFQRITQFSPDVILISQGGTFDFFGEDAWWNFIGGLHKPFSVISQSNVETGGIAHSSVKLRLQQNNSCFMHFYFVSLRNLQAAQRQAAYRFKNAQLIDNPVNIKEVAIKRWPEQNKLSLACVARYECAYKGQDLLIQALSNPAFAQFNFHLDLYGKGPDKDHLSALVNFYQLGNKITINEHVSDIDLIWSTHHVLVLSSITEGTPLALQECMLNGRPALVTDVGDCSRLIVDGETGFIIEGPSIKAIEKGLARLFACTAARLQKMGEDAYESIIQKVDLQSPAFLFEQLCKRVQ